MSQTTVQMHDQEKRVAESFELISKENARQSEQYAPSLLVSKEEKHKKSCCEKTMDHLRHPESLLVILIMIGKLNLAVPKMAENYLFKFKKLGKTDKNRLHSICFDLCF